MKRFAHLCEVELQRIVRTQADIQSSFEILRQWVPLIGQEERVVAQRTHRDADLLQIKKILKSRDLTKQDAVGDGVRSKECRCQVVGIARLAGVWTENECA